MGINLIAAGNPEDFNQVDGKVFGLKTDALISLTEPKFKAVGEAVARAHQLMVPMNAAGDINVVRSYLVDITGNAIDESTIVFPPFYTNFGRFIQLGKKVFINHACSFLDLGGIVIEDEVLIGPRVNIVTENHPMNPANRSALICKPVKVKRKAWIGAGATLLPGVTIGENAVVAAGAVVTRDVPDNTIVGGVPAKVMKSL
ncbi:Acetyltransferase (isoleucine patch superfamily) [Filimonas lacunae]|uniref:Acetyltransferase (Isoleucine patch superfamily) n=1 Tax=Filimonas lacunae TaxID=477680 RepID=A0A173MFB3_9BACT|nr:DapH/DapD/GlmU-related protein [Filimonas lacunae]BAV06292.1 acetyltransferase, isoleucine patch superfamily [Filimonas lacunae]SIT25688.1 Acetyltransferase (isoleucine patch superfamily) [Filimonas lacunae]